VLVVAAALAGLGVVAQFRAAKAPAWARFVDGSMAWAVKPERRGPVRYVAFALTPRTSDGSARYAMLEAGGAHEWRAEAPFSAALTRGGVFAYIERPAGRPLVVRAPAWALWGVGVGLMAVPLAGLARRRWAIRKGRCVACGYDRRGIASGAPCPECGAACGA